MKETKLCNQNKYRLIAKIIAIAASISKYQLRLVQLTHIISSYIITQLQSFTTQIWSHVQQYRYLLSQFADNEYFKNTTVQWNHNGFQEQQYTIRINTNDQYQAN